MAMGYIGIALALSQGMNATQKEAARKIGRVALVLTLALGIAWTGTAARPVRTIARETIAVNEG
jgi:hypothetical protein